MSTSDPLEQQAMRNIGSFEAFFAKRKLEKAARYGVIGGVAGGLAAPTLLLLKAAALGTSMVGSGTVGVLAAMATGAVTATSDVAPEVLKQGAIWGAAAVGAGAAAIGCALDDSRRAYDEAVAKEMRRLEAIALRNEKEERRIALAKRRQAAAEQALSVDGEPHPGPLPLGRGNGRGNRVEA